MPDSSSPLAGYPAARAQGPALLASLSPLLAEWLPRQRWFAGDGRELAGFSLVSAVELLPPRGRRGAPGLLHLLVRAWHRTPESGTPPDAGAAQPSASPTEDEPPGPATQAKGSTAEHRADCYQLLLGVRASLPAALTPALLGRPATGPLRGLAVYEALLDPRLTTVLLERLRTPGRLGPLRFTREAQARIDADLTPRPLATEQSNSSVIYGTSHILKLFRRIEPGVNPDLELSLALARHGCDRVPAPSAWFEAAPHRSDPDRPDATDEHAEPETGNPARMQGRQPDGAHTSARSGGEPASVAPVDADATTATLATPASSADPAGSLTLGVLQPFFPEAVDGWQLALRALGAGRHFTAEAHALGRATAEVHHTLATALPTTPLGPEDLASAAAGMANRLAETSVAVPALRPYQARLLGAFRELAACAQDGRHRTAQRVHGDLHLGQVLRGADGGWSLIDFEGEPARPLVERCRPQPAVRDLAGMLRSFDYAACRPGAHATDDPWAREWAGSARAAYCAGYAEATGVDPRADATLLRAYETDKAIYEVRYEAQHRPSWLPVPLSAVRRLAAPPAEPHV